MSILVILLNIINKLYFAFGILTFRRHFTNKLVTKLRATTVIIKLAVEKDYVHTLCDGIQNWIKTAESKLFSEVLSTIKYNYFKVAVRVAVWV